jgi:alpha-galactosidase
MTAQIEWAPGRLKMVFRIVRDRPVVVCGLGSGTAAVTSATQPLVELMLTGEGRARTSTRFTGTAAGSRLRYVGHMAANGLFRIEQADPETGLRVVTTFTAAEDIAAARVVTTVINGGPETVILEAVSSFATGAVVAPGASPHDLVLYSGRGEWLAENRWTGRPLWSQRGLSDVGNAGRGSANRTGTSTWTTGRELPTGALVDADSGHAAGWQIEHNGGWRWEVDDVRDGEDAVALVLLGPEDLDHHWSQDLVPGAEFSTVPVSIAVSGDGFAGVVAELTRHRRWLRRERTADRGSLLVFNDYMNTLNGDPTTERLLPLIASAAAAGAECFCIDAGWYDDTPAGLWWPSVGEWVPSARRFPGGLSRVTDVIRAAGMRPGLWLEPEVVGVDSPVAVTLPDEAFLQRHGRRVREHDRYFLDLRHPAATGHLDTVFDRLIADFGIGFFKLDYNVTPGPGTDRDAFSAGAGLLGHNRAHLAWFAALRARHPGVVFENCSSGAMRADFAMLEHFDFQSTSDQEDFRLYPAIAAGAPVQMLPEQAGNWAYPQAPMSAEEIAYTMVTGLSGRLYLSGFLDRMAPEQLALVHDATALFREIRADIARSVPGWPLGLPDWYADTFALTLTAPSRTLLYVWHRGIVASEICLPYAPADLTELYPRRLEPWPVHAGPAGTALLHPVVAGPSARVYRVG